MKLLGAVVVPLLGFSVLVVAVGLAGLLPYGWMARPLEVVGVGGLALSLVLAVRALFMNVTLDGDSVRVRGLTRTRRIPVDAIAGVEVDESFNPQSGFTYSPVMLLRDGGRVRLWMLARFAPHAVMPAVRWLDQIRTL
jgi:Bacterial PH domain